jgi:hypothetical protein
MTRVSITSDATVVDVVVLEDVVVAGTVVVVVASVVVVVVMVVVVVAAAVVDALDAGLDAESDEQAIGTSTSATRATARRCLPKGMCLSST